jgi:dihydrofolate synthase/folylpolyglutamate synthase
VVETGLGGGSTRTTSCGRRRASPRSGSIHRVPGDTLEAIAGEKAGIFKPASPAVSASGPGVAGCGNARARARVRGRRRRVPVRRAVGPGGTSFELTTPAGTARLSTPLVGAFQASNVATAITMLDAAGGRCRVSLDEAAAALGSVRLPGRFQRVGRYVFDVAHNPDGAAVLAATLQAMPPGGPIVALVSVLEDKDWRSMLRVARAGGRPDRAHARADRTGEPRLGSARRERIRAGGGAAGRVRAGLRRGARSRGEGAGTVLVTGSFHTVGDAMARLQVSPLGA